MNFHKNIFIITKLFLIILEVLSVVDQKNLNKNIIENYLIKLLIKISLKILLFSSKENN